MTTESSKSPEEVAKAVAAAAENLTSLSKDELLKAAEALKESGVDVDG